MHMIDLALTCKAAQKRRRHPRFAFAACAVAAARNLRFPRISRLPGWKRMEASSPTCATMCMSCGLAEQHGGYC
jgi:hypothetical protein